MDLSAVKEEVETKCDGDHKEEEEREYTADEWKEYALMALGKGGKHGTKAKGKGKSFMRPFYGKCNQC